MLVYILVYENKLGQTVIQGAFTNYETALAVKKSLFEGKYKSEIYDCEVWEE